MIAGIGNRQDGAKALRGDGSLKRKSIVRLVIVIVVVVIVAVSAIAIYTPLILGPFEPFPGTTEIQKQPVEPSIMPAEPEEPETPAPSLPVEPEVSPTMENKLVLSEKELQDKLAGLLTRVKSADMELESLSVKLEQDRMLVSTRGTLFGIQAEIEDLEVRFDGKTVTAEGPVKAAGFSPILKTVVDINTVDGIPGVEVKEFKLGAGSLLLSMFNITKERITEMVNSNIKAKGMKLPFDVEKISIEDGKLIIEHK